MKGVKGCTMVIYKADKKDIIDLCDMWFELQTYHKDLAAYVKEVSGWRAVKEKELMLVLGCNNTVILIAREGNNALGYIKGCIREKSPVYENTKTGMIEELFVKEEARKAGIGRNLVHHLKLWFLNNGISEVIIHVSYDNLLARSFWNSMGFETNSIRMIKRI